ncbi:hypothetical protein ABZ371_14525 [Streptomyces sp. NPDC005899]|uniref:hypothetical protein n=1 Tax=Streptomyces sp. NPDC005899 TaxID=3155716 RepID=UPI0033FD0A60
MREPLKAVPVRRALSHRAGHSGPGRAFTAPDTPWDLRTASTARERPTRHGAVQDPLHGFAAVRLTVRRTSCGGRCFRQTEEGKVNQP